MSTHGGTGSAAIWPVNRLQRLLPQPNPLQTNEGSGRNSGSLLGGGQDARVRHEKKDARRFHAPRVKCPLHGLGSHLDNTTNSRAEIGMRQNIGLMAAQLASRAV